MMKRVEKLAILVCSLDSLELLNFFGFVENETITRCHDYQGQQQSMQQYDASQAACQCNTGPQRGVVLQHLGQQHSVDNLNELIADTAAAVREAGPLLLIQMRVHKSSATSSSERQLSVHGRKKQARSLGHSLVVVPEPFATSIVPPPPCRPLLTPEENGSLLLALSKKMNLGQCPAGIVARDSMI